MRHKITTMSGVERLDEQAGAVTVEHDEGSTLGGLLVTDGEKVVRVHLDWTMTVQLMAALGDCAMEL